LFRAWGPAFQVGCSVLKEKQPALAVEHIERDW